MWDTSIGGGGEKLRLALGLALDNGVLYAASRDGEVVALDPATGKTAGARRPSSKLPQVPALVRGLVVVGNNDGVVAAFEAAGGKQLWKTKVSSEVLAAPLVAGNRVIVRTVDGRLHSLDAADGKEHWSAEEAVPRLSLRGTAPPVLAGDDSARWIRLGQSHGFCGGLRATCCGRRRSRRRAAAPNSTVLPTSTHRCKSTVATCFAVGYQGRVAMLALDSGQIWWSRELSSYRGLALDDAQLYVSTADGSVAAMRRSDGTVLWQQDGLKRRGLSAPAVVGNAIVVGDFEGYLHWLDRDTGKFVAREHAAGERISASPVTQGDRRVRAGRRRQDRRVSQRRRVRGSLMCCRSSPSSVDRMSANRRCSMR